MCDIITRWRGAGSNLGVSEPVANFVGQPDWKKKAYVKQAKNMSGRKFEKSGEKRKCLVCDKVGHLVKDCRDPRKEAWIEQRRRRDDKKSSEHRGRSKDRHSRDRHRNRCSQP